MATNPAISDVDRIVDYTPVGSTAAFIVNWPVFYTDGEDPKDDLGVIVNGVELATTDFEFVGTAIAGITGCYNGGTLTLDTAVASQRVILWSKRDPRRVGYYLEGKALPMTELDKLQNDFAAQMRDLDLKIKGAILGTAQDALDDLLALPLPAGRANKFPYFDANGALQMADGVPSTSLLGAGTLQIFTSNSAYATLAAADAVATGLGAELVIDKNFTLASNTTLNSKSVRFAGGVITRGVRTLTFVGHVTAPSVAIFDAAGTGLVTMANAVINVKWFGALGTGIDDTTPVDQAMLSGAASVAGTGGARMYFPQGSFGVKAPVKRTGPMFGDGAQASTIKALSGFVGTFLLDYNYSTEGNWIDALTLDITALGAATTVSINGSTSTFGQGGGANTTYRDVWFLGSSTARGLIRAVNPGTPEVWMLTGSRFLGCKFIAPMPFDISIGDDLIFLGCRIQITDGATNPIGVQTTNTKFLSTYCSVTSTITGDTAIWGLGSGVHIDGLFIEGGQKMAWFFQYYSGSHYPVTIENVESNYAYTGASGQPAFMRANIGNSQQNYGITLRNFSVSAGVVPFAQIFSLFNAINSVPTFRMHIRIEGYDDFLDFARAGTGGIVSGGNRELRVIGEYRETRLYHDFTSPVAGALYMGSALGSQVTEAATV